MNEDINLDPKEGLRVFKKTENSPEGTFVANTVVEFPIDPRTWIAGMALQALLSSPASGELQYFAKKAVKAADCLLQELKNS